ncbi:MAG TPA: energy transducer TonB [Drouetiella sp.]
MQILTLPLFLVFVAFLCSNVTAFGREEKPELRTNQTSVTAEAGSAPEPISHEVLPKKLRVSSELNMVAPVVPKIRATKPSERTVCLRPWAVDFKHSIDSFEHDVRSKCVASGIQIDKPFRVRFNANRDSPISGIRVAQSSGKRKTDESAVEILRGMQFPVPYAFDSDNFEVEFTFDAKMMEPLVNRTQPASSDPEPPGSGG